MFYEVIYEDGTHSIMQSDDEAKAIGAVREQHRRATAGERSLASDPASPPATRIVRLLAYDKHPGTLYEDQLINPADAQAALDSLAVGDLVSVPELVQSLRNLTNPLMDSDPHESNFVMPEAREIDSAEWSEAA